MGIRAVRIGFGLRVVIVLLAIKSVEIKSVSVNFLPLPLPLVVQWIERQVSTLHVGSSILSEGTFSV